MPAKWIKKTLNLKGVPDGLEGQKVRETAALHVYWVLDMLSRVNLLFLFTLFISFFLLLRHLSHFFLSCCSFLCLKPTDLCHCLHPLETVAFFLCSLPASIHLSITSTLGLSLPLISLPIAVACVCRLCQNCYRCCHFPWREQSRPLLMAPQKNQKKRA